MSLLSWTRAKARALIGVASAATLLASAVGGVYLVGGAAHASNAPTTGPSAAPTAAQVDHIAAILAKAEAETASAPRPATPMAPVSGPAPRVTAAPVQSEPASAADLECLAAAVYYEARGEPMEGQAAVAQVVLNRTGRSHFPKTVCGVVYQRAVHGCQFSFACNGAMNRPREWAAWVRARAIAARALAGYVMADIGEATSFHATHGGAVGGVRVGGHVFFAGGGGAARARPVILARANAAPAQPRYTFSLGVLTEVSATRRAPMVLAPQPAPASTQIYPSLDATIALPKVSPAAS